MKLVLCKQCSDILRLLTTREQVCSCGQTSGKYEDSTNAWYRGKFAVPLGFITEDFVDAVRNQPTYGDGRRFEAFVIPKNCETFKHIV